MVGVDAARRRVSPPSGVPVRPADRSIVLRAVGINLARTDVACGSTARRTYTWRSGRFRVDSGRAAEPGDGGAVARRLGHGRAGARGAPAALPGRVQHGADRAQPARDARAARARARGPRVRVPPQADRGRVPLGQHPAYARRRLERRAPSRAGQHHRRLAPRRAVRARGPRAPGARRTASRDRCRSSSPRSSSARSRCRTRSSWTVPRRASRRRSGSARCCCERSRRSAPRSRPRSICPSPGRWSRSARGAPARSPATRSTDAVFALPALALAGSLILGTVALLRANRQVQTLIREHAVGDGPRRERRAGRRRAARRRRRTAPPADRRAPPAR